MTRPLNNTELLLSTIVLSIGSLLFMFLLILSYFTRKKKTNIRNRIYVSLLITTLILILSEFLEVIVITYTNSYYALLFSFKLHWGSGFLIFAEIYYYCMIFMDNLESYTFAEVIKHSKHTKIMTVVHILFIIVFLLLPFDFSKVTLSSMSFFPGLAAYSMYIYAIVIESVLMIHLVKNKSKVLFRRRVALWSLLIVLVVIFMLQVFNQYIAILVIGGVIQMYFLYFNVENPDLIMIADLEQAKENIDRSNRAKTDFLSNMSYEIKEPMKEMVDFNNQLSKSSLEKTNVDAMNILISGSNLLNTVNNILNISKIESGENILELKEYSLVGAIQELTKLINLKLHDKQIKFVVEYDESIPPVLYGDPNMIVQVFLNIIDNSIKYTSIGIIKLKINCEKLSNEVKLHIRISDSGNGMKKEELDSMNERLSKLNIESYIDTDASGLGLAITKKYIDLMNGSLKVESEYKAGTAVYIDLPQKIVNK